MPVIVTDIKDKTLRDRMNKFTDGKIFFVQKSGFALSALLCVVPL